MLTMVLNYIVSALKKLYPILVIWILLSAIIQFIPDEMFGIAIRRIGIDTASAITTYWILITLCLFLFISLPGVYRSVERYTHEIGFLKYSKRSAVLGIFIICVPLIDSHLDTFVTHRERYFILGFILIALALWCAIVTITKKRKSSKNVGQLQPDKPLKDKNLLTDVQLEIYDGLLQTLVSEEDIKAIGLFGDWGSGKTTIIDLVADEMKRRPNIIWLKFEPWRYTSQEALTLGFYEQIGTTVDGHITGKNMSKSTMINIATKLVAKNDKGSLASIFEPIFNNGLVSNREKYLTDLLERENKKLIIVIDDLERMYSPESIFRALQLAHYLKNSENITYIFLAEKEKLISSAPDHQGSKKGEFLEKFIEFEFNIPTATGEDLRRYLDQLLALRQSNFKKEFVIKVADELIEDSATHRGILRTFNKFVLDLDKKFYVNEDYNINLSDKYILDHLSVKYPQLWLHIDKHRDLYVGKLRNEVWNIKRAFEDPKATAERNMSILSRHIDEISDEHREFVRELLYDLFPYVKFAFENNHLYENHEKWLKDKRVAHPDILALYFASSKPYSDYQSILDDNGKLSESLENNQTIRERINLFKKYLEEHSDEETSDFLLFLKRDVLNNNSLRNRTNARALLRAYAEVTANLQGGRTNSILARILSILDDLANPIKVNDSSTNTDIYFEIFTGFLSSNPHPSVALTVVLYLHPNRQNSYFNLKKWGGYEDFRIRSLYYVNRYYLSRHNNLLNEYNDSTWTFILYQWLYQIKDSKIVHKEIKLKTVNKYFFGLLKDDRFSYDTFSKAWWGPEWSSDIDEKWNIGTDMISLFDEGMLLKLLNRLEKSEKLTLKERKRISLLKALVKNTIELNKF